MSRFEFVADHRDAFGVKQLCTVLNLSRSGFYRWLKTALARAANKAADAALTRRIRKIHTESGKSYGAKRITAEPRGGGAMVNRKRVERLMRQHGIQGRRLKRRHRTTVPDPAAQAVPDLLRRNFTTSAPDRARVGDITYLPIAGRRSCIWPPYSTCSRVACWAGRWPVTCGPSSSPTRSTRPTVLAADRWTASFSTAITGLSTGRGRSPMPATRPGSSDPRERSAPSRTTPPRSRSSPRSGARFFPPCVGCRPHEPPALQSSAGSASTTTGAGTPRSATSRRSPSNRD